MPFGLIDILKLPGLLRKAARRHAQMRKRLHTDHIFDLAVKIDKFHIEVIVRKNFILFKAKSDLVFLDGLGL